MSDSVTPASTPISAPTTSGNDLTDLKATVAALESQTHTLRVILLLVILALCAFFWREAGYNNALAVALQPQATQISQFVAQLEQQGSSIQKQMQALQKAALQLAEYGKSHPDYLPILVKYGLRPAAAPAAETAKPATPAANPAPAKK